LVGVCQVNRDAFDIDNHSFHSDRKLS
jgi:hypothetical protein